MKIISSAPTRISIIGGGTDVSPFCDLYGGVCLSMAINLRQQIVFDDGLPESIIPPKADWRFYYKFFEEMGYEPKRFRADFDGEITGGIGSSAAAAVALVGALCRATDIKFNKNEIAQTAWNIEVNKLGLFGGKQDQWSAAYGGVNLFKFSDKVEAAPLSPDFIKPVLPYLMLFHTGKNRKSAKIQEGFKKLTPDQIRYLCSIRELVSEVVSSIIAKDIKNFAALLDISWEYKKMSNEGVSNDEIDRLFNKAKKCGAMSGKLAGAGGGGYVLFVVEPEKQKQFREKIGLKWIDWDISWDGVQTRII